MIVTSSGQRSQQIAFKAISLSCYHPLLTSSSQCNKTFFSCCRRSGKISWRVHHRKSFSAKIDTLRLMCCRVYFECGTLRCSTLVKYRLVNKFLSSLKDFTVMNTKAYFDRAPAMN